jgi:hypothetical protein
MPHARIDLAEGKTADYRRTIGEVVYDAVVEVLKAPKDDRFTTEEVVKGPGAVEFRQRQPSAVHEGHDLWLKALKDLSESKPRP